MRSATITFGLAMATASLLLATGCSSTTTGAGVPTAAAPSATAGAPPSASASSSGGDQTFGAPRVTTPLDTTKYQQNPCWTFGPTQQQKFGIVHAGTFLNATLGPGCTWGVAANSLIAIIFAIRPVPNSTQVGLANVYETLKQTVVRLPDIDGQPAVRQGNGRPGQCVIFVGATDSVDYQFKIILERGNPDYADPCGLGQRLAAEATITMKSGA